ncbi:helix-turn-helix domain-containing protein, partial [Actinomadura adrarensis]
MEDGVLNGQRSTPQRSTTVNATGRVRTMTTFGEKMRALMTQRRMSLRRLESLVNYDKGYLSKVSRDLKPPPEPMAVRLDQALDAGGELVALAPRSRRRKSTPRAVSAADLVATLRGEAIDLATWAEQTNVGHTTIGYLASATRRLAKDYLSRPPVPVLAEA